MKKRAISLTLATLALLPTLTTFSGCSRDEEIRLRVYSWEEYIDEGGEGSYVYDEEHKNDPEDPSMIDESYQAWYKNATGIALDSENTNSMLTDFELYYEHTYGKKIKVEYSTFGTNEDMYNQLKLGDTYDLLCPSEYMIMKLAAEDMLEPYSEAFHDGSKTENYYTKNVSPFIQNVFDTHTVTVTNEDGEKSEHKWSDYAAGYMWGTTGLIYNPETVKAEDLKNWNVMLSQAYENKVTTKDNVRDSYFVGLAILYQDELMALKERPLSAAEYNAEVTKIMNRTDEETVEKVQEILLDMKGNLFGFETDTGKTDLVKGNIWLNFAWSGDAVYAMDLAEEPENEEETPVYLNYFVPEECANLWFDGWVMPKGAQKEAAEAFVNFMSMPYNAIRNSYYIGYTSAIASEETFAYADYLYGSEEGTAEYDLSYFFGEGEHVLFVDEEQISRQLGAQYPSEEIMNRCAVMDYFDPDTNDRINELWAQVKGAELDAWAIVVISVGAVFVILAILYVKFGAKIDFFRRKPKKGYQLVKQEKFS